MPSSNYGFDAGVLFGRFPNQLGHLHNPDHMKQPKEDNPWALDNGVYGAWSGGRDWDEHPFYSTLEQYAAYKPLWVVVPDAIGDKETTLNKWHHHSPIIQAFDVPLALAVQDGMEPKDVKQLDQSPDIIFVGGTTTWKWRNLKSWTENFPRVHVGRVNTYKLLWMAHDAGAESCDGTGWFRGCKAQIGGLIRYLEESGR